MKFIANTKDVAMVDLEQMDSDEVAVTLDGDQVAYFDHDENEFVIWGNILKDKFGISASVEEHIKS